MKYPRCTAKTFFCRLTALFFWGGLILWLSLHPSPPKPPSLLAWDKLQHALAFALLTWFAGRLFLLFGRSAVQGWFAALGTSVLFGALVEIAQAKLTTERIGDPLDLLANFCGAAIVFGLAQGSHALKKGLLGDQKQ